MSRDAVEHVLGQPIRQDGQAYVYEYYERPPGRRGKAGDPLLILAASIVDLRTLGGLLAPPDALRQRKGILSIIYSHRGNVVSLRADEAERDHLRWLASDDASRNLVLLCQSANQGWAPAQFSMAVAHRYGLWGLAVDPVQARLWARLAASGGNADAQSAADGWAAAMTPEDVTRADALFDVWNPADC